MIGARLFGPLCSTPGRVTQLLASHNRVASIQGVRGMAALKNWKTPSMDEIPPPEEPWEHYYKKKQARYNRHLILSVSALGFTLILVRVLNLIPFYGEPSFARDSSFLRKNKVEPVKDEEELVDPADTASSFDPEPVEEGEEELKVVPISEGESATEQSAVNISEEESTPEMSQVSDDKQTSAVAESLPEHIPYLLIGAGTASMAAYRAIKALDATAKIIIIGDENRLPYMRPPLSKEMWYGETAVTGAYEDTPQLKFRQWNGKDRSLYFEPEQFYIPVEELISRDKGGISIVRGHKVVKIDPDQQIAYLDDGRNIKYDKCLIATGGSPKPLAEFESVGDKVTLFRRVDDYFSLSKVCKQSDSIVVVGGGFLGSELACALASWSPQPNLKVTQVFPERGNMAKVLPEYLSQWTTEKVRSEGVTVFPDTTVTSAKIDPNTNKLVLKTSSGNDIVADHAIVAVGLEPESQIGKSSNLELDSKHGGYKVNEELESKPNLWVAGDAASFNDVLLGQRRVEHHDNAVVSGRLAGENMAGKHKKFSHQSMFWSDLGPDIGYEAIGIVDSSLPTVGVFAKATPKDTPKEAVPESGDTLRISEIETNEEPKISNAPVDDKPEDYGKGVIFYLRDNIVVGVLMWNVFNKVSIARKVIQEHKHYDDLAEVAKLFNLHQKIEGE